MGWHVAGAGAMGVLWSARLARAGEKVTLVLRNRHRQRRAGPSSWSVMDANPSGLLRVKSGVEPAFSVEVPTGLVQDEEPIEKLLLAVKSPDLGEAIRQLKPRLRDVSAVVIMCQQPAVYEELVRRKELSEGMPFVLGTTSHNAYMTQHFHVVHSNAAQGSSWFGLPPPAEGGVGLLSAPDLKGVKESLGKAGMGASIVDNIIPILWMRLAMSCVINPLTALYQCSNDELQESKACLGLMRGILAEIMLVMNAHGVAPEGGMTVESLYQAAKQFSSQAQGHYSSMSVDVRLQRKTEIDYFNGFVVRKAAEAGLKVPMNEMLHGLIMAKSDFTRPETLGHYVKW